MEKAATHQADKAQSAGREQPRFSGFSHISLPVRDLQEAKRFFMQVLGGELEYDTPGFVEVRVGGILFGFSQKTGGWTAPNAEFPHYAFFVQPENFLAVKEQLERHGVPTHQPWTRDGVKALMYFRDPSGNLFEMYCAGGFKDAPNLPRPPKCGGNFSVDFEALNYDWHG
jgi:catechol 2,3-dioxygenase-like lactoylglutathione lyase family enzyme